MQIHKKLPSGSILVFMTGRREVHELCEELTRRTTAFRHGREEEEKQLETEGKDEDNRFSFSDDEECDGDQEYGDDDDDNDDDDNNGNEESPIEDKGECQDNERPKFRGEDLPDDAFRLDDHQDHDDGPLEYTLHPDGITTLKECDEDESARPSKRRKVEVDGRSDETEETNKKQLLKYRWMGGIGDRQTKVRVVPLYALLSTKDQSRAFQPPNQDERLIIVSTNVAETSLTLPNVRYVVDCGREKKRQFLSSDVASLFSVQWISKASADQRAGRAGRIGPGHCYRLYSSAMYTHTFPQFPTANLFLTPLDSVLLFMASLGIPDIARFPFPNPPPEESIRRAKTLLLTLGALEFLEQKSSPVLDKFRLPTRITQLGRLMAKLPVAPRFSAMLVAAIAMSQASHTEEVRNSLIPACAALVSGWSVGNLIDFSKDDDRGDLSVKRKAEVRKVSALPYQQYESDVDAVVWMSVVLHDCVLRGLLDNVAARCDLLPSIQTKTTTARSGYYCSDAKSQLARNLEPRVFIHESSSVAKLRSVDRITPPLR
ncbi:uncharacterized protein LOC129618239 [Condylostylus longicornis]|uniref:uncharacterized protein LOC129618239 n=1 Tax=Condylostylus longicornis TaxID=2530218 RepID=UPI00244E2E9B|nr:uncharacterized protein LOC129618239 [Condylostylus longicornis]